VSSQKEMLKWETGLPYQIILFCSCSHIYIYMYVFSQLKLEHFKSSLSGLTLMEDGRGGLGLS